MANDARQQKENALLERSPHLVPPPRRHIERIHDLQHLRRIDVVPCSSRPLIRLSRNKQLLISLLEKFGSDFTRSVCVRSRSASVATLKMKKDDVPSPLPLPTHPLIKCSKVSTISSSSCSPKCATSSSNHPMTPGASWRLYFCWKTLRAS